MLLRPETPNLVFDPNHKSLLGIDHAGVVWDPVPVLVAEGGEQKPMSEAKSEEQ